MTDTFARQRQLIGTTAEWAADDLVVGEGEIAFETTATGIKWKVGNGTDKFSVLSYTDATGSFLKTDGTAPLDGKVETELRFNDAASANTGNLILGVTSNGAAAGNMNINFKSSNGGTAHSMIWSGGGNLVLNNQDGTGESMSIGCKTLFGNNALYFSHTDLAGLITGDGHFVFECDPAANIAVSIASTGQIAGYDPTLAGHLTTKRYVDQEVSNAVAGTTSGITQAAADNRYLKLSGGMMTGAISHATSQDIIANGKTFSFDGASGEIRLPAVSANHRAALSLTNLGSAGIMYFTHEDNAGGHIPGSFGFDVAGTGTLAGMVSIGGGGSDVRLRGNAVNVLDAVPLQQLNATVAGLLTQATADGRYSASGHKHSGADITSGTVAAARIANLAASKITSGTFAIARIPTGSTSTTVALGNHTHSNYQAKGNYVPYASYTSGTYVIGAQMNVTQFAVSGLAAGNVQAGIGGLLYINNTVNSDRALKENIVPLGSSISNVMKLNPVEFDWKDTRMGAGKNYGFIAQDVQAVFPELCQETEVPGEGEVLGYRADYLTAYLVKALQELKTEFDTYVKAHP